MRPAGLRFARRPGADRPSGGALGDPTPTAAPPAPALRAPDASSPAPPAFPVDPVLIPGEVIAGRYQVVRFIAQGGMAQVFEAVDGELRQAVAIKILRPEIAASPEQRERMRSEVLLARRIAHPAVCRVFDLFHHPAPSAVGPGTALMGIAMEYLPGETLAARLARPFSLAQARQWVADLAAALVAAHAEGVVHLDLKPSNVLLARRDRRERAVLSDFGIARAVAEVARDEVGGGPLGTPDFLAPEVQRGERPTPAADVFSLGKLLERLVGAAEAPGSGPPSGPPNGEAGGWSARRLRRWKQVAATCCREEPERRFASAAEVAAALGAGRAGHGARLAAAAALGAAGLSIGLILAGRAAAPGGEPRAAAPFRAEIAAAEAALDLRRSDLARDRCAAAARLAAELGREARLRSRACLDEAGGDPGQAAAGYRALWTLSPGDVGLAVALARLEGRLGRGRQALAVVDGVPRPVAPADEARLALAEAEAAGIAQAPERRVEAARRALALLAAGGGARAGWAELLLGEGLAQLGRFEEAKPALERAARALAEEGDRYGAIRAGLAGADLLRHQGDYDGAGPRYEAGARAAREAGDSVLEAQALRASACSDSLRGRPEAAEASCRRALEVLAPTREEYEIAATRAMAGRVAAERGDFDGAARYMEEALASLERLGAESTAAEVGFHLSQIDWRLGRLKSAQERLARAASLRRQGGDAVGEVVALGHLVWVQLEAGEVAAAAATVAEAAPRSQGAPAWIRARLLTAEALVRYEQDDLEAADRLLADAARLPELQGATPDRAVVVSIQATVAKGRGDLAAYARFAEESLALAEAVAWPESIALGEAMVADLLLDRGEVAPARVRFDRASRGDAGETPLVAIMLGRTAARLRAAEGDLDGALVDLEHLRRRSAEAGFDLMQGEVELVLAELLQLSGRPDEARAVAGAMAERARGRGQLRLARLAGQALSGSDRQATERAAHALGRGSSGPG